MPDVYGYSSDPGKELRTSRGAVINLVRQTQRTPEASAGVSVLGVVGSPANDRGVPNVPVVLSGIQEIFARWGGFKASVGDGAAAGYNGNVAALLWSLLAARVVFQPVDMAIKDKSISDATAVDLKAKVTRTFSITGEADNETLTTDRPHGLAVGDEVTPSGITGGTITTGSWTGTKTVATVPSATTLTLAGVTFSIDVTAGTLTPAEAAPYVLPAGTQLTDGEETPFVVRTLEDVSWAQDDASEKSVRVAKVSGAVAALSTVNEFVDAAIAAYVRITTTAGLPDDTDAAEILLRYGKALDTLNATAAGQSVSVLIADRTEAGVGDALSSHCAAAGTEGIFRVCVVAPPVGTSVANAEATTGDGAGRASLNGDYAIYAHPAGKRRFPLDGANLSAVDDYKATFPAHAVLAAKMLLFRPEENPTAVDAEPGATYGFGELEHVLTREQKVTHFQAGICTTVLERLGGRRVVAWRDGIMVSGTKIADKRLEDFIAQGLIERLTPWHKRLASVANQRGAVDACETWLIGLEDPNDQRIAGHVLTPSWDGDTEEFTVQADVVKLGNLDIITIKVGVTASGFTVLTAEAA